MKIIEQLKGIATFYVQNKEEIEEELKQVNGEISDKNSVENMKKSSE